MSFGFAGIREFRYASILKVVDFGVMRMSGFQAKMLCKHQDASLHWSWIAPTDTLALCVDIKAALNAVNKCYVSSMLVSL